MYQSKRSPLMIFISIALVILTACGPAAPTAAPAGPQATEPPAQATEAPAAPRHLPRPRLPISVENTLSISSNISDLITLDPAVVYEYSGILVTHNVYQTLVTFEGC